MNIYDEAKNNIKDIEERFDELDNRVALESIDNLKLFIERAKKVEELLELYKELSIIRFYLFFEKDTDLGQELMDEDDNINKQIKIKEKELEEMK